MSGVRVEVVTPCEHGHLEPHVFIPGAGSYPPGATNLTAAPWEVCWNHRTFTEWPPEAIEAAARAMNAYSLGREQTDDEWESYWNTHAGASFRDQVTLSLAAAWGHITGDNK